MGRLGRVRRRTSAREVRRGGKVDGRTELCGSPEQQSIRTDSRAGWVGAGGAIDGRDEGKIRASRQVLKVLEAALPLCKWGPKRRAPFVGAVQIEENQSRQRAGENEAVHLARILLLHHKQIPIQCIPIVASPSPAVGEPIQ